MTTWPSIQRDSEILRRRIAAALLLRSIRERLERQFEQPEKRAA